jgi:hypothetical protein
VVEPVLDEKSGFLVGGENFVRAERGLLRVAELSPDDNIVGISREGITSWSSVTIADFKENGNIMRITTDSSECLLAPNCEIFTVEGIKRVSGLSLGDLVETANIPFEILEMLEKKALRSIQFDDHEITLDEKLGYVLGAQIRSEGYRDRVVFDQIDTEKAYLLASLCDDIRKTSGIGGKIFYVRGGKRIRFDSWILAQLCEAIWKTNKIAIELRESPPRVMHAFVAGILDMILQRNKIETPPTFFSTKGYDGELRRFILNVLRLYGVIPARMHCVPQKDGAISFKCSINTSDLSKLGLRFIRAIKIPPTLQEAKAISYSAVRNISRFRDTAFCLSAPEPHWSPIVDLAPLHRHALES